MSKRGFKSLTVYINVRLCITQSILNVVTWLIARLPKFSRIFSLVAYQLHCLPLNTRIHFKILILTFNFKLGILLWCVCVYSSIDLVPQVSPLYKYLLFKCNNSFLVSSYTLISPQKSFYSRGSRTCNASNCPLLWLALHKLEWNAIQHRTCTYLQFLMLVAVLGPRR